jgi:hypothetical protein
MVVAPGHAHLPAIIIQYTLIVFWLRSTLYHDTAPLPPIIFVTGDNSRLRSNLYRDTHNAQQTLYLGGKNCAVPSLHRDSFLAKVPGPCSETALGNTTSPYCRAVRQHISQKLSRRDSNDLWLKGG